MSVLDQLELLPRRQFRVVSRGETSSRVPGRYLDRAFAVGLDVGVGLMTFALWAHWEQVVLFPTVVVATAVFIAGVAWAGGYDPRGITSDSRVYRGLGRGVLCVLLAAMAIAFFQVIELSPLMLLVAVVGLVLSAAAVRWAQQRVVQALQSRGWLASRALLVGQPDEVERAAADLGRYPGLDVLGACVPLSSSADLLTLRALGTPEQVARVSADMRADLVLVVAGSLESQAFRTVQWELEQQGTELAVLPGVQEVVSSRLDLQVVGTTAVMGLRLAPSRWQRGIKATMDRLLGALLLALLLPVIGIAALVVRGGSRGPALFRQIRIGRAGRPFTMYKLRTMTVDAEDRRDELAASSTGAGPLFKMTNDPRVTAAGRILRRFSIDELPQLWNVVRGDMSLVGPRPPLASEVASYDAMSVHRLHVKPGLTGLWQVSGRSDLSWEESIRLDLRYVDNWSVGFDLLILWRTFSAVLGARGAY